MIVHKEPAEVLNREHKKESMNQGGLNEIVVDRDEVA